MSNHIFSFIYLLIKLIIFEWAKRAPTQVQDFIRVLVFTLSFSICFHILRFLLIRLNPGLFAFLRAPWFGNDYRRLLFDLLITLSLDYFDFDALFGLIFDNCFLLYCIRLGFEIVNVPIIRNLYLTFLMITLLLIGRFLISWWFGYLINLHDLVNSILHNTFNELFEFFILGYIIY